MTKSNTFKTATLAVLIAAFALPMLGCSAKPAATAAAAAGTATGVAVTATLVPAATTVPPAYKDWVFTGFEAIRMSPQNFTSNRGTNTDWNWWWNGGLYSPLNSETKKGVGYFWLNFPTKQDMAKRTVYDQAVAQGLMPTFIDLNQNPKTQPYNRVKNLDITKNFPTTCKGIYFDKWWWDFTNPSGDPDALTKYVLPDIKACVDKIKTASPDVKVYVGGYQPYTESFPRLDTKAWPKNGIRAAFTAADHDKNTPAIFAVNDAKVKAFCDQNGYTFVDYTKIPNMYTSTGWMKEEYADETSAGQAMTQQAFVMYCDYVMDCLGLPHQVFPPK